MTRPAAFNNRSIEYQQRADLVEYLNHSAIERSFALKEALTVNPHLCLTDHILAGRALADMHSGNALTKYRITSESVCAAMHNFAVLQ